MGWTLFFQILLLLFFVAIVTIFTILAIGSIRREDPTTYDEDTLNKVYTALQESGLSFDETLEAVTECFNAGIVFRERL